MVTLSERTRRRSFPRLVATDLDGTLLDDDGTVSPRTAKALSAAVAAGSEVVLVTARPARMVDELAAELPCHPLAICANGALLYDARNHTIVRQHSIEPEAAAQVVARLREELGDLVFAVELGERFGHEPGYVSRWETPPGTLLAEAEVLVALPVAKLLARYRGTLSQEELLERARTAVGDLAELSTSSWEGLLELAAVGVSKATALAALASELGIGAESVIAFGDMPNDLPMLAWAGHSVAVANAHPEVLALADEVTAASSEDGVAQVIERLLAEAT